LNKEIISLIYEKYLNSLVEMAHLIVFFFWNFLEKVCPHKVNLLLDLSKHSSKEPKLIIWLQYTFIHISKPSYCMLTHCHHLIRMISL